MPDIALDLHSHGVHTSLIQRGSTTVVSIDPSARLNEAIWDEGGLLEACDLIVSSATPPLIIKAYKAVTQRMLQLDTQMIEGLVHRRRPGAMSHQFEVSGAADQGGGTWDSRAAFGQVTDMDQ